jgi:hypothetical protein
MLVMFRSKTKLSFHSQKEKRKKKKSKLKEYNRKINGKNVTINK